jgi:hypothetical protein
LFRVEPVRDRAELRERCEALLRELTYKAEMDYSVPIAVMPKVIITPARTYYARILQQKFAIPVIRVNSLFLDFYKANPIYAESALRFVLAHEVAHIVQRKKYGIGGLMLSHPLAVDEEANRIAERLTGMTFEEFHGLVSELHKMVGMSPTSIMGL